MPETAPSLRRFLEQQKRQANRAGDASPFSRSGTGVTGEDEFTVDGTLIVTGPMTVGGTLSLPAGIIDNDALASPLTAAVAAPAWANNWSATNSWVSKATSSIAVPAGYAQALVTAMASVTTVGSVIRYDIRANIAGSAGPELQNLVNGVDSSAVAHTHTLTGLSGGTISIATQVWSTPNLAAHTGNIAVITGFAIFFR
jgi:hypothetical protein